MKYKTGRPPRNRNTLKAAQLPPIDSNQRYSISESAALLRHGRVKVYELIAAGRLVSWKEGRRRFVTGASIIAISRPPA